MNNYLVIYGAGHRCLQLLGVSGILEKYTPIIVDSSSEKVGTYIVGCQVNSKNILTNYSDCLWCVTITDFDICASVQKELIDNYGFLEERQILYYELILDSFKRCKKLNCLGNGSDTSKLPGNDIKNNTKIFFGLTDGLVLGGIEERVKQLCLAMIQKGFFDAYIVTDMKDYNYDIDVALENHIIKRNLIPGEHINNVKELVGFISSELPCTVITNLPNEFLIAAYIVKYYFPSSVTVVSIISGASKNIFDNYLKLSSRSDFYIGVSKDIKSYFLRYGGVNALSMTVPFPCDKELVRDYSIEIDKPVRIGYAGRLDGFRYSQKRMDLLLEVFKELEKLGVNFLAELAGEGPARDEMIKLIREYKLDDKIHFCGRLPKSKMMAFWKKQDIGINMADYEGRSISIAEMMGGGAVPVVTCTSGVNEDITDGVNGFIVPIGDFERAVNKIKYLYDNRSIIPVMGKKAHDEIWPKSSMDNHLIFWRNLLNIDI